MRNSFVRITGIIIIIAAVSGLLFSLIGLVALWRYKAQATEMALSNLTLTSGALETTAQGLAVAKQSLDTSIASATDLQNTVKATARTIHASIPLLDTLETLSREDLPNTIATAQTSLASAQESARIIDNLLNALSFLPGINYNPPVPLNVSLAQVSASMDSLPPALLTMERSLEESGGNLQIIESDISMMAADIQEISASMEEARTVVEEYQVLVADLKVRVDNTTEAVPEWINLAAWVLTFFLAWMIMTQVGLLFQGWEMVSRRSYPE